MQKQSIRTGVMMAAAVMATSVIARASVTTDTIGTSAPPTTMGAYTMTPFPTDTVNGDSDDATTVPGPSGTSLTFTPALTHTTVGDVWGSWSNGYTGDVYYSEGNPASSASPADADPGAATPEIATTLTDTIGLPSGTQAFYLYIEPNSSNAQMTAVTNDGTTLSQTADNDGGADGYGFYTTDPGEYITSVTVTSGDPTGFAVGEFGISVAAVPEPASAGLVAVAAAGALLRRRRRAAVAMA